MGDLSPHFSYKELACKETGTLPSDEVIQSKLFQDFLECLEDMRVIYGRPMKVNSWLRSPGHSLEKARKRAKRQPSTHSTCLAIDIRATTAARMLELLAALYASKLWKKHHKYIGIGINPGKFLHIDIAGRLKHYSPNRPSIWVY